MHANAHEEAEDLPANHAKKVRFVILILLFASIRVIRGAASL
jgi:hypothetical protein